MISRGLKISGRINPVGDHAAAAAVFVSDPEIGIAGAEEVLARLYDLTRGETRVACLILQGKNVEQVAKELKIAVSTVRQSDLVRLVLTSPATLRTER